MIWCLNGKTHARSPLSNIAELFLHVTNGFLLIGGSEADALTLKEPLHPSSEDTTGNLILTNGVRNEETFEDGDSVCNTMTRFASETSAYSGGDKGHDTAESNVDALAWRVSNIFEAIFLCFAWGYGGPL